VARSRRLDCCTRVTSCQITLLLCPDRSKRLHLQQRNLNVHLAPYLTADLPNYGRWLPGSEAFGETTEVSPYPDRLGTTYLDAGPAGQWSDSTPRGSIA